MPIIYGQVIDKFTGMGIPATITAGTVMTTSYGSFSLTVVPGTYTINVICKGYDSYSTTLYVGGDVNLGTIYLSPIFSAL